MRSAAQRTCTPVSSTTRSAPSTRSRPRRRRSARCGSRSTVCGGGTRPSVLGHPLPDGGWALLHRDREVTAAGFDEHHPGDGEAWLRWCADWDRIGDELIAGLLTPFPPVRAGLGVLARLPRVGGLGFVRTLLTPAAELGRIAVRRRTPAPAAGRQRGSCGHPARRAGLRPDGAADDDARPDRRVPGPRGWCRRAERGAGPPAHRPGRRDPVRRRGHPGGGACRSRRRGAHPRRRTTRCPTGGRRRRGRRPSCSGSSWTPTTCRAGSPGACRPSSSTRRRSRWTGR